MGLRDRQQLVITLVALGMGAVFVFGQYLPVRSRADAAEHDRRRQTTAIAQGGADARMLPILDDQLADASAVIDYYESGITEQRQLGNFLSRIADLMKEHDFEDQLVAPAEHIRVDDLNCIPINMQCTGRFSDIFDFYRDLAELDRFVRIERITFSNDEALSGLITMKTRAVIFYRSQQQSATERNDRHKNKIQDGSRKRPTA